MDQTQVGNPILKVVSAWALIGVTSWAEAASFFAAMYTLILILEWAYKKAFRPLLIYFGVVSPKVSSDAAE